RRRSLGQDDGTHGLGLLREEAAELGHREDDVAVVPHRRRRRDPECRTARQHVYGLARYLAVGRKVGGSQAPLEELAQRRRIDDRAGEEMRARLLPLLEHGDGDVAEALADLGVLLEQLAETDRAGETPWAGPDDEDAHVDALLGPLGPRCRRRRGTAPGGEML